MHLRARNVMSRQVPKIWSMPSCEPATKRSFATTATAKRSESAVTGGERIPGFEVPELERHVGGSGQRAADIRQRRHRHTSPSVGPESELFRRRCHVIENWMRLRR